MHRNRVFGLALLLALGTGPRPGRGAVDTTPLRDLPQLGEEMKIWVAQIRAVQASGRDLEVAGTDDAALARLRELLGPFVPAEQVQSLSVSAKGEFEIRLKKKHVIDIPYAAEHFIIRVTFKARPIRGRLTEAPTMVTARPVTLIVFDAPHFIEIDRLNEQKESTIPGIGKVLGLQPNIVALAYVEDAAGPRVAPQLNGLGVPENARLFKELLQINDTLLPENLLASSR